MKRNAEWIIVLALVAMLAGCEAFTMSSPIPRRVEAVQAPAPPPPKPTYLKDMVQGNAETPAPTAVDSAMVWARKYTEATEKVLDLERENQRLTERNRQLEQDAAGLKEQLARSQRDIDAANAMLLETRSELNKWKSDVLGYRDEIRRAQQVIIEYQVQIVKLLNGEVFAAGPTTRPAVSIVPPEDEGK